ncbi:hypothetical protein MDAP_002398 [Mitosporidium daphniae]
MSPHTVNRRSYRLSGEIAPSSSSKIHLAPKFPDNVNVFSKLISSSSSSSSSTIDTANEFPSSVTEGDVKSKECRFHCYSCVR